MLDHNRRHFKLCLVAAFKLKAQISARIPPSTSANAPVSVGKAFSSYSHEKTIDLAVANVAVAMRAPADDVEAEVVVSRERSLSSSRIPHRLVSSPMAVSQNRSRVQDSSDEDEGTGGRLDAPVELKDPRKTLQHLFLQSLISRRCVKLSLAKKIYSKCLDLCGREFWPEPKRRRDRRDEQEGDASRRNE